jgi:hypothetical protein
MSDHVPQPAYQKVLERIREAVSDRGRRVRRRDERRPEGRPRDERRRSEMTQYLIAFDDGDMIFPEEELPDVAKAAQAVVREAREAGVWVFGAGLEHHDVVSVVATDGTVTDGPYPESKEHLGGFAVVDVPSREAALEWAAKIAVACRCAQQVFELLPDPTAG